jgi:hypothetical protein
LSVAALRLQRPRCWSHDRTHRNKGPEISPPERTTEALGEPHLFGLVVTLQEADGDRIADQLSAAFGVRSFGLRGYHFPLNGEERW